MPSLLTTMGTSASSVTVNVSGESGTGVTVSPYESSAFLGGETMVSRSSWDSGFITYC